MKSTSKNCLICQRIKLIKEKKNPLLIKEFETGYAVFGDNQYFMGYSLFLCKVHKFELHELEKNFKLKFLEEMSQVAEAIYRTYKPNKLNYELLGNNDRHLHWHIFPRYKKETHFNRPVWEVNKKIRYAKKYIPSAEEIEKNILKLENL